MAELILSKEESSCPICINIMIEPVTMPCQHSLCMPCYRQTVAKSSLTCPICRQRISVWARRASKQNKLIDVAKWEAIQRSFPQKVQQRLEGKEGSDDEEEDFETKYRKMKELSQPGEIREEYEAALKKLQQQREEQAKKEEEQSKLLIAALQEEDKKELEKRKKQLEETASLDRILSEELSQASKKQPVKTTITKKVGAPKNKKGKNKANTKVSSSQSKSCNLTMETFYDSIPKQSQEQKSESPYPYQCLTPEEKIFYGLEHLDTLRESDENSCDDDNPLRLEHTYTTSAAGTINLTDIDADMMSAPRGDLSPPNLEIIKMENLDIYTAGPSCSRGESPPHISMLDTNLDSNIMQTITVSTINKLNESNSDSSSKVSINTKRLLKNKQRINGSLETDPSMNDATVSQKEKNEIDNVSSDFCFSSQDSSLVTKDFKENDPYHLLSSPKKVSLSSSSSSPAINASVWLSNHKQQDKNVTTPIPTPKERDKETHKTSNVISEKCDLVTSQGSTSSEISSSVWLSSPRKQEKNVMTPTSMAKEINKEMNETSAVISEKCDLAETQAYPNMNLINNNPDISSGILSYKSSKSTNLCDKVKVSSYSNCSSKNRKKPALSLKGTKDSQNVNTLDKFFQRQKELEENNVNLITNKTKISSKSKNNDCEENMNKRKRHESCSSSKDFEDNPSKVQKLEKEAPALTQEEKDRLFALELQNMYSLLDKQNVKVDRFKGSTNEYSFRRPRK